MRAKMNERNTVCSMRLPTLAAGLPLPQRTAGCSKHPEPPTIEITRTPPASQGGRQWADMMQSTSEMLAPGGKSLVMRTEGNDEAALELQAFGPNILTGASYHACPTPG